MHLLDLKKKKMLKMYYFEKQSKQHIDQDHTISVPSSFAGEMQA